MSILVTGGFGMLGSAAVRELVGMGEEVVVLGRSDHRERLADVDGRFGVEIGDVGDLQTVYDAIIRHDVDRVCHVAASLTSGAADQPRVAYQANVAATVHLLSAAQAMGVRRFVFISSKAVYALPSGPYTAPTYEPVPEDYRREPSNLYGATKLAAELMVEQYARAAAMSAAIVRFGTTYGPGKSSDRYGPRADISRIIESTVAGRPVTIEDTGECTDCIYVDDIGRGIALAVTADRPGVEAYNVASGVPVTLRQVVEAVQAVTSNDPVKLVPVRRHPGSDRRNMVLDVRKAAAQLGFEARFDLTRAIQEYVKAEV